MGINRSYVAVFLLLTAGITAKVQAADSGVMLKPAEAMIQNNEDMCCLGWSRKGTCAFIVRIDGGVRGGYALRLLLLDTVEDAVLFDDKAWADELAMESDEPEVVLRALAASDFGKNFADACTASKIDFSSNNPQMKTFPLRASGTSFSAILVSNKSKEPLTDIQEDEAIYGAQKLDIQVIVRREGKGSKQISTIKGVMASSFDVAGCFLSPFESRMLVIYKTVTPGFEGDPHVVFGFAGCHLELGFKTP